MPCLPCEKAKMGFEPWPSGFRVHALKSQLLNIQESVAAIIIIIIIYPILGLSFIDTDTGPRQAKRLAKFPVGVSSKPKTCLHILTHTPEPAAFFSAMTSLAGQYGTAGGALMRHHHPPLTSWHHHWLSENGLFL